MEEVNQSMSKVGKEQLQIVDSTSSFRYRERPLAEF